MVEVFVCNNKAYTRQVQIRSCLQTSQSSVECSTHLQPSLLQLTPSYCEKVQYGSSSKAYVVLFGNTESVTSLFDVLSSMMAQILLWSTLFFFFWLALNMALEPES
ncbi:hypothetical protein COCC4DRAFT_30780, partial [Bipolaris maydis ATCC 48331]